MSVTFIDIVGYICIAVIVIEIIMLIVNVCNPKQQNNKRSFPPCKALQYCYWENKDRMWNYFNHWECKKEPKALLLLCHGICEHSGRYGQLGRILISYGIEVYAMDHRGHGRSDGYRNYINSMSDVIQDNCDFLELIHSKHPNLPVFVMGHSMGGMIAISVTHKMKHLVKAAVYSAPALMIQPALLHLKPIVTFVQCFAPKLTVNSLGGDSMCHDDVIIEDYRVDILNTPGTAKPVPARTALQLLNGIIKTNEYAKEFDTPFLMMQGREDSVCLPKGAEVFVERALSSDKELKWWENSFHEIMNEANGEEVMKYAAEWILKHL